jgi:hypothetical protein
MLRHVVGSPEIMRAQFDELADLAHEPGMRHILAEPAGRSTPALAPT